MNRKERRADPSRFLNEGVQQFQAGNYGPARAAFEKALKVSPGHPDALYLQGLSLHKAGRSEPGARAIKQALANGLAANPETLNNAGQVLKAGGFVAEAAAAYRRALEMAPRAAELHNNLGNALAALGDDAGAITAYRAAIQLNPQFVLAYVNLADALKACEAHAESLACLDDALRLAPGDADVLAARAGVLIELGRLREGYEVATQVLSAQPDHLQANVNAGVFLELQGLHDEALPYLQKGAAGDAPDRTALLYLGIAQTATKAFAEGYETLSKACDLFPDYPPLTAALYLNQQAQCRWDGLAELSAKVDAFNLQALERGQVAPERAVHHVTRCMDPAMNLRVARSHAARAAKLAALTGRRFDHSGWRAGEGRLRLGYLSGDYRNHPVAHSIRRLFELHDRAGFEVFAYSSGPNDGSDYRKHFEATADRFIDIREMDDAAAAEQINADGVDILIDLSGHTSENRLNVSALRPAPVQIQWFGYPGTVGGDFFDYAIVDATIAPPEHRAFFSERLVDLPHSYMMVDDLAAFAEPSLTRADEGLPEDAFVFASFCEPRKYEPETFEVWMDLLNRTPGSVLWLLARDAVTQGNLIAEAKKRGVAADRLVFARFRPKDAYLSRLRLADLALDTRIYNGHVTTADYLLAGLPTVAMLGGHFASRVSAGLLAAAGMTELVAPDLPGYADLALDLAQNRDRLADIRARLAAARDSQPLFDAAGFVRDLEEIYRRCAAGG